MSVADLEASYLCVTRNCTSPLGVYIVPWGLVFLLPADRRKSDIVVEINGDNYHISCIF